MGKGSSWWKNRQDWRETRSWTGKQSVKSLQKIQAAGHVWRFSRDLFSNHSSPFCSVSFPFPAEKQKLFLSRVKRGRSTPLPSFRGSQDAALEKIPCQPEAIPLSLEQILVLSWWGHPGLTGPCPMPHWSRRDVTLFLKCLMLVAERAILFRNCSKMVSISQEGDVQVYLMVKWPLFVWDWVSDQWLSFKVVELKPSKLREEPWRKIDAGRWQDGYREELSSHLTCGWVEQNHGVSG